MGRGFERKKFLAKVSLTLRAQTTTFITTKNHQK